MRGGEERRAGGEGGGMGKGKGLGKEEKGRRGEGMQQHGDLQYSMKSIMFCS